MSRAGRIRASGVGRALAKRSTPGTRLFVRLLWSERRLLTVTVILSGVAAVLESLGVAMLVPVLQQVVGLPETAGQNLPVIGRLLAPHGRTPSAQLILASMIVLGCVWFRAIAGAAATITAVRMRERILDRLRRGIFDQLLQVSFTWLAEARNGALVNTLTSDHARVEYLVGTFTGAVLNVLLAGAYGLVLLALCARLAMATLAFAGVTFLLLSLLSRRLRHAGHHAAVTITDTMAYFSDRVAGMRTVRLSTAEEHEMKEFGQKSLATAEARGREAVATGLAAPVSQAVGATVLVTLVVVAYLWLVDNGSLSGPALLAFFFALFRLVPTLQMLINGRALWIANSTGLETFAQLLDRADKPYLTRGPDPAPALRDGIELRNVSFRYERDAVLDDVSLRIPKGATVAVVGASGAGKSTLLDLLCRFYDPDEGSVLWDGRPLPSFEPASLRRRLGIVSQDTFVFDDTVRANVAYGADDADDASVRAALRVADAETFVDALPDGLDTRLGERGVRLSGGQRQRLAIARAVFRDPDVLLLDEATSSLDGATERSVQNALERAMAGRTVVIVAHRLSTVRHADVVVVLAEGSIVEEGPYDELLVREGALASMHRSLYGAEPA